MPEAVEKLVDYLNSNAVIAFNPNVEPYHVYVYSADGQSYVPDLLFEADVEKMDFEKIKKICFGFDGELNYVEGFDQGSKPLCYMCKKMPKFFSSFEPRRVIEK